MDMNGLHIKAENGVTAMNINEVQAHDTPQQLFGELLANTGIAASSSTTTNPMTMHGAASAMAAHTGNFNFATNSNCLDPSIQESLSPFFQPFGVDVSHFPMTNPPIFQNTLANYGGPPRRRRISISNGQIGQLGENMDSVENIYYTQPPPLPHRYNSHQPRQQPNKRQRVEDPSSLSKVQFRNPSYSQGAVTSAASPVSIPLVPQQEFPRTREQPADMVGGSNGHAALLQNELNNSNGKVFRQERVEETTPVSVTNTKISSTSSTPVNPGSSESISSARDSDNNHIPQQPLYYQNEMVFNPNQEGPLPGTAAWKRARLLERNRIAASKCRQRKKIAQQQLQKDVDVLARENREIRRKLEYYEKLVSKFKKFTALHMDSCGGNKDGLRVIEEMLMIDHDLGENENGLLVKSEDK